MGNGASQGDSRSEYLKYIQTGQGAAPNTPDRKSVESTKRELKSEFLRARNSGLDGEALFDHMAQITERSLASPAPRRKFNYPGHILNTSVDFSSCPPSRAASDDVRTSPKDTPEMDLVVDGRSRELPSSRHVEAPMGGYGTTFSYPENGDARLGASLVQVDSLRLRNRHRPLRRAAKSEMMKLQENRLSII